ncbi:MAG: DUF4321 domain-containing protein [Bacillota bacterium]|nr:DUF4321 domain-containing protein [Bacillota bacterium]
MRKSRSYLMIFFLIVAGSIMGNIIGGFFSDIFPVLSISESIFFGPAVLDLNFLSITFGFTFSLSLAGLLGVIVVLIIFKIFY